MHFMGKSGLKISCGGAERPHKTPLIYAAFALHLAAIFG
jgi:hypothetical protein